MDKLFKVLEIKTNNQNIYDQAFTHSTYVNEMHGKNDYQTLEFLGDGLLQGLVSEFLFKKYPSLSEGDMTLVRSSNVNTKALAFHSKNLELSKYLKTGNGAKELILSEKVNADLFESLLAALHLDEQRETITKLLDMTVFGKIINDIESKKELKNPKTILQEFLQAETRKAVTYDVSRISNQEFKALAFNNNIKFGTGIGKTKQEAEENAALEALDKLKGDK